MSLLPSGTVTFLLTDVEGSTKLWENNPVEMADAVARLDVLVSETALAHSGHLIKSRGEGDSAFLVFGRASDAAGCALALQQQLAEEPWPGGITIRIRASIHTGEAELRDGDYFGATVNRTARLRAIAHGGQTLLSKASYAVVGDLPAEVTLRDLGSHRLKDLVEAEHVWQVCHPDLDAEFPALRSLDARPNNLPTPLTSFLGRERELADLQSLLVEARLVTLTGIGGCGKTRLAIQAAADLLEEFPDGVWFVGLAALTDPALVPQAITVALSMRDEPGRSMAEQLESRLKQSRVLIVLDNCEHVIEACAGITERLLHSCPGVSVVATSREPLGIAGEVTRRVPSLSVPDRDGAEGVEALAGYEAIRLFVERAQLFAPDFGVTASNAAALAQICCRLDGIPLAIELAAARIGSMSIEQIEERLGDRFRLLGGGPRSALPRHRTLRAAVDWSYALLSEEERSVLRRLAVFSSGFLLEASEAVCGDGLEVVDLLSSLVSKSLVGYDTTVRRYQMNETIRQFAHEKMLDDEDIRSLQDRRLRWCVEFVALAADALATGAAEVEWLDRIAREMDNIREAFEWAIAETRVADSLALTSNLRQFVAARSTYTGEYRELLGRALALSIDTRSTERARALAAAGTAAIWKGDFAEARSMAEESLAIARQIGDRRQEGGAIFLLGAVAQFLGELTQARELLEHSLALGREQGDDRLIRGSLNILGETARLAGDLDAAGSHYLEAAKHIRRPDSTGKAVLAVNLGFVALAKGEREEARAFFYEALSTARTLNAQSLMATSILGFAELVRIEGDLERAARLLAFSERTTEATRRPVTGPDKMVYEACAKELRVGLGEERFAVATAEGRAMSLDEAIAFANDPVT